MHAFSWFNDKQIRARNFSHDLKIIMKNLIISVIVQILISKW